MRREPDDIPEKATRVAPFTTLTGIAVRFGQKKVGTDRTLREDRSSLGLGKRVYLTYSLADSLAKG